MSEIARMSSKSKRLGFGRACNACRKRKHRCDAIEPQCSGCRSRGSACEYSLKRALSVNCHVCSPLTHAGALSMVGRRASNMARRQSSTLPKCPTRLCLCAATGRGSTRLHDVDSLAVRCRKTMPREPTTPTNPALPSHQPPPN